MDCSFPKSNRILKALEFQNILNRGQRVVSKELVVIGMKTEAEAARLGLIVSRKVGKATIRNRIKRQLREYFRVQKQDFSGTDIVVIARHTAGQSVDLPEAFAACLHRLQPRIRRQVN